MKIKTTTAFICENCGHIEIVSIDKADEYIEAGCKECGSDNLTENTE